MDTNAFAVLKLFMVGILAQGDPEVRCDIRVLVFCGGTSRVNNWMARGSSATESLGADLTLRRSMVNRCNETQLQWEMEMCGDAFKREMNNIDPQNWCNLTHFISEYHLFTLCTETKAERIHCFWPNPLVEGYIIRIHQRYFSNCTVERVVWVDPPDDTVTILILTPVLLTLAMIALVVWCSKRSDILA